MQTSPSFSSCLSRYLRENAGRAINGSDRSHAARLEQYVGHMTLDEITPKALSEMRDRLLLRYANQTVKHTLGLVSRVYRSAEQDWFVWEGDNPVRRVRKPSTAHTGRDRVVSRSELDRIVARLGERHAAFVMAAYETGMRRGEITRIKATDLSPSTRTLRIPQTKTGRPRTIPVSRDGLRWIGKLLEGPIPSADSVSHAFQEAATRAGVRGVRLHDLRHSAVTRFFELGLNMMEVAAISGHETLAMLSRYTHLSPERLAQRLG